METDTKMNMIAKWGVFFFMAQVLSLGLIFGEVINIYRNVVNVTRGQSVLLPMDYTLTEQVSMYTIEWMIRDSSILFHEVSECNIDSLGFPTWSRGKTKVYPKYNERVKYYELNGSLLLHNVQDMDSGLYTIILSTSSHRRKGSIAVWVHPETMPSGFPTWSRGNITVCPNYEGRLEFYTLNGSLVLHNVLDNDSGIYTIILSTPHHRKIERIAVMVHLETMSSGPVFGEELNVCRKVINVTNGQSVLLPVNYTLAKQVSKYSIEWMIRGNPILFYEVSSCSLDPQGFPTWSKGIITVYPNYEGRVEFYTLNGSLMLHNVLENDSGIYTIILSTPHHRRNETIAVMVPLEAMSSGPLCKDEINIYTRVINVTSRQSVVLLVDYNLAEQVSVHTIQWMIQDNSILFYEALNCSIDLQGFPTWSKGKLTVYPDYKGRVEFYTMNGSLVLRNVQDNDSGIYTIVLSTPYCRRNETISMMVDLEKMSSGTIPSNTAQQGKMLESNDVMTKTSTETLEGVTPASFQPRLHQRQRNGAAKRMDTWIFVLRTALCSLPIGVLVVLVYLWGC